MGNTYYRFGDVRAFLKSTQRYITHPDRAPVAGWGVADGQVNRRAEDPVWVEVIDLEIGENEADVVERFLSEYVRFVFDDHQNSSNPWSETSKIKVLDRDTEAGILLLERLPTTNRILVRPDTYVLDRQIRALHQLQNEPLPAHEPLLRLLDEVDERRWPAMPDARSKMDWRVLLEDYQRRVDEQGEFVGRAVRALPGSAHPCRRRSPFPRALSRLRAPLRARSRAPSRRRHPEPPPSPGRRWTPPLQRLRAPLDGPNHWHPPADRRPPRTVRLPAAPLRTVPLRTAPLRTVLLRTAPLRAAPRRAAHLRTPPLRPIATSIWRRSAACSTRRARRWPAEKGDVASRRSPAIRANTRVAASPWSARSSPSRRSSSPVAAPRPCAAPRRSAPRTRRASSGQPSRRPSVRFRDRRLRHGSVRFRDRRPLAPVGPIP